MYNRVGRVLTIVGKQLRHKFRENPSVGVKRSTISPCGPKILFRTYCDRHTEKIADDVPTLVSMDEEGKIEIEKFMSVPENEKIFKIIELEIEVLRQNSEKVPDTLRPRHWAEIIKLDSRSKRRRYLQFLWGLERKKENDQRTKDDKRKAHEALKADGALTRSAYSLGENSLFLRFYDQSMNRMWNGRLINKMMYGQKIVLDCGYEDYMNHRENKNCSKQIQLCFATNRMHDNPFDMHLCNANPQGELMKTLHRSMPPLYDPDFPLNITGASYLDVFDKKQLLYLTPHCTQEIQEFDHDTVYIVGAFVDKSSNEPVSMAKAKKEGLRMAKFPLDRYLQWGASSGKNLTLNQVIDILLDLRMHGSWEKALRFVPRRKLFEARAAALERRVRNSFRVSTIMNYDGADENDAPISPLQEIKPKASYRFNAEKSYKPRRDNESKSSYSRDYQPSAGRVPRSIYGQSSESKPQRDFTIASRPKFKSNWKN